MRIEPTHDLTATEGAWDDIERLVQEVGTLAKSGISTASFYRGLLDQATDAMAAIGGAVWLFDDRRQFHLEYQIRLNATCLVTDEQSQAQHARLLHSLMCAGEPQAIAPQSGRAGSHAHENPSPYVLLTCPIGLRDDPIGMIEVFQRPEIHPAAQRGNLRLLAILGDLAFDFHRNLELRDLRVRLEERDQARDFASCVHQSLDLRKTAYAVANEGRRLLGCDRVSVVMSVNSKCEVIAISGVSTPDRRANAVRYLRKLATLVIATGEPLWYRGDVSSLAPPLEQALQAFLEETHVRVLAVVPLVDEASESESAPVGALVVEQFQADKLASLSSRVTAIRDPSYLALRNALAVESLPLRRISRALQRANWFVRARQLPKTLLVFGLVLVAALLLGLVPANLEIQARGELQPLVRRDLFAPIDGEISELHVAHDDKVSANDLLAELRSSDLALALQRLEGEIETTSKRIQALESERVLNRRDANNDHFLRARLTAEEVELKQMQASQRVQLEILHKQRSSLMLRSPIGGRVLTWEVERLLAGRPVRRGQLVMSVADVDGPWIAELHVPHDRIAHVLEAHSKPDAQPQSVSFILATQPGRSYSGTLQEIARAVTIHKREVPDVRVTVSVDRDEIPLLRPGTTVVAKIRCGRRSIGYVWFHDLLEAVQTSILF